MNDTAMCLFNLFLIDKVSQMALYIGVTTELPDGDAAKVWPNMFKVFHAKNINEMNEFKREFVKSKLYSDSTNPDEWFAELCFIRRRLEGDYKCTTFGDVVKSDYLQHKTCCLPNTVTSGQRRPD
jgi:hypothetical protein